MKQFSNTYKGKKVLVTGHTGFKGSWLVAWLNQLGAEVFGFSDRIPTIPSHFAALKEGVVDHFESDIGCADAVTERILSIKPDFVFHLAAQAIVSESMYNPVATIHTNAMGTAHVLDAIRKLDESCVAVFITSDKCYENIETFYGYRESDALGGKDPYSASKAAAECVFHAFYHSYFEGGDISMATARAGNVIGGGDWAADRLIPDLIRAWQSGGIASCRRPDATRPWQHVLEPLSGYLALGECLSKKQFSGQSFNFGPRAEDVYSVGQVIEALRHHLAELKVEFAENTKIHDAGLLKLNCDQALNKLKWKPVLTFPETIESVATWYQSYYRDPENTQRLTDEQIKNYCNLANHRGLDWAS